MRLRLLIPLVGALALTAVCANAAPPPGSSVDHPMTPTIAKKQAEAQQILNDIAAIDEQLNATSEQFDGARVRLLALRKNLKVEEAQLGQAKARYHVAQQRAAKFVVWLYTQPHGSSLDVILGARNLGEMLKLSDAENAISRRATVITNQAAAAKEALEAKVRQLARDRAAAASTVRELAARRAQIQSGLSERRKLLTQVETEVRKLQAKERARQERLAAIARARIEAEIRARARAQAAAAAAARKLRQQQAAAAAAQARAAVAATTTTTDTTTTDSTSPSATTPTTTTTTPAAPPPITTASGPFIQPSPVIPTSQLPSGHPEAAQLALQYLGVPYVWGGSTPAGGFDCSGLVSYVYAQLGVLLPHFAAAQWEFGVPVTVSQLQPGDLVFFDALDHVGIYLGDDEFINAPHTGSWVRIDTLSEPWYHKHYVGARRV
jgi:cell wall-associated NlpC family hydrolase